MEPARIRYYAHLTLSDEPLPAAAYLGALVGTGLGVRSLGIFGVLGTVSGPWSPYASTFVAPLATRYINVVCCLPGIPMGRPLTARQFAPGRQKPGTAPPAAWLPGKAATPAPGELGDDEVIYTPQSALTALYTVGVGNIAITVPPPRGDLSAGEQQALARYDAVITCSRDYADALLEHGVTAQVIDPQSPAAPAELRDVLVATLEE